VVPDLLSTKLDRNIENLDNNDQIEALQRYLNINPNTNTIDTNNFDNLEATINNLQKVISKCSEKVKTSIKQSQNSTHSDLSSSKHKLNNSKEVDTYNLINIYRHGVGLSSGNAGGQAGGGMMGGSGAHNTSGDGQGRAKESKKRYKTKAKMNVTASIVDGGGR